LSLGKDRGLYGSVSVKGKSSSSKAPMVRSVKE